MIDRRNFLVRTGLLAAASGLGRLVPWHPLAALAQAPTSKDGLIVRSVRPEDFETPVTRLGSWLTPNELFFVRSHMYSPDITAADYQLMVDGDVERPLKFSLADLRQMARTRVAVTLECAGNGRGMFEPPVAGVQWQKGAVGNAYWTGVRLRDVLQKAGVKAAATHVWLDGADVPIGRMPDFIRNVPIAKAMDPDTLLAYEMNDSPLPVAHGFPLRAIVPGWEGAYSVKWLTHIQVADREHDGFFVKTAYRFPTKTIAPGAAVDPKDMAPVQGLVVKSIIASHADGDMVTPGALRVAGLAWAGEADIAAVDVSRDGGATWDAARLGVEGGKYAWRTFSHEWPDMAPGSHVLMSRARDDRGRVQPIVAQWNPSGYLWNAIDRIRVNVAG